jgi:hydroxymethylpyrimidine/phosphomethylpyrimidine kinase
LSGARLARLLIIAGSDSSGGAGIQGDIKTATVFGAYAMTAITAVTVQDTRGIHAIHPIPEEIVRAQIRACVEDIGVDAIKIGMLGSAEIVETVANTLRELQLSVPVVLDPVLASTSGTAFLDERGIQALRKSLIPLATLVTPNLEEAETLSHIKCDGLNGIRRAGATLIEMGAKAVLLTGADSLLVGDRFSSILVDVLVVPPDSHGTFSHPRINSRHTHGTGCAQATAIAIRLAQKESLQDAILSANSFIPGAILEAPGFGSGHGPLNHMHGIGGKNA